MIRHWEQKGHEFPKELSYQKLEVKVEKKLLVLTKSMEVPFFSLIDSICTEKKCQTMADNRPESIIAFDDQHLSNAGAVHLIGILKAKQGFLSKQ